MRLAFMGFRHGHILGLWKAAGEVPGVEIVGACEEDPATAAELRAAHNVQLTHERYEQMLNESGCDAVAVGDYYGKRGEIILAALGAGKHVIADKPICTRMNGLEQIEKLARAKGLCVGCMLDLRTNGTFRALREMIGRGEIGEVQTVNFTAQHPLLLGSRPGWYFEAGKQGGTLNDIGVHAVDLIEWATGRRIVEVVAARVWNMGRTPKYFQEGGQMMLRLDNGGGVLGDVSYLAPDGCGYSVPQYWRVVCHGDKGVAEVQGKNLSVATHGDKGMRPVEALADLPLGILESFVSECAGKGATRGPSTGEALRAGWIALIVQEAADEGVTGVSIGR